MASYGSCSFALDANNKLKILFRLAATLGAKSSLKKLNKRSVMTADITGLCDLIAEPSEPLALRLSSNLMVGAARSAVHLSGNT